MKTFSIIPVLIGLFLLAIAHFVQASDGRFEEMMKKNIQTVYQAQSIEELQQSVNAFDRIASVGKSRWEPLYYSAFGNIMMANREKDIAKKDQYLDMAFKSIEKAKAIAPEESEVVAIDGFAYMIRVSVDPSSRGPQYAGMAMQLFNKATQLNPENPRAWVFTGQMQFSTAQFFGSSTSEACGTVTKALEKFASFKSENPLAPQWGKRMAEDLKQQCK